MRDAGGHRGLHGMVEGHIMHGKLQCFSDFYGQLELFSGTEVVSDLLLIIIKGHNENSHLFGYHLFLAKFICGAG